MLDNIVQEEQGVLMKKDKLQGNSPILSYAAQDMSKKEKFLKFFPIFYVGTIFVCFLDGWLTQDFIALGIITIAGGIAGLACFQKQQTNDSLPTDAK